VKFDGASVRSVFEQKGGCGMTKRLWVVLAAMAGVAFISGLLSPAWSEQSPAEKIIRLTDRFGDDDKNFTFVDVPPKGFDVGDYLVARDVVYNHANTERRGFTHGDCLVIQENETYECDITFHLNGGTLTAEGSFFPRDVNEWAVTGGTGAYKTARGELMFVEAPSHLALTFRLVL
jgi:hypothetical protein